MCGPGKLKIRYYREHLGITEVSQDADDSSE